MPRKIERQMIAALIAKREWTNPTIFIDGRIQS